MTDSVVPALDWDALSRALRSRTPASLTAANRAAVAVILREGTAGIELLFIHRAEHPADPWSGHMAFPGGRAEPGETARDAVIRETAEEVGIDLSGAELLGALDEVQAMRRMQAMDLVITPLVFRVATDVVARPDPLEVQGACWLSLADLLGSRYRSTYDHHEGGASMAFPCLRVEVGVIWGLTYRMFRNFAACIAPGSLA